MKKIYHWICETEKVVAMTGIVLMTIFIFLGAVSRAVGHPFSWTTDLGVFMLAWSTFLGGDIAFREGRLANLDIVLAKFPVKAQKGIASAVYAIIVTFLVCMIYFGIKLTYSSRFRTFNGIQGFSYSWVTVCMPVCAALMLVSAVGRYVKLMKETDRKQIAKL